MTMIEEALTQTTDTKACEIGPRATEAAAKMFRELFPDAEKALVIDDPRTRAVAGERVISLLKSSGLEVSEHVIKVRGQSPRKAHFAGGSCVMPLPAAFARGGDGMAVPWLG